MAFSKKERSDEGSRQRIRDLEQQVLLLSLLGRSLLEVLVEAGLCTKTSFRTIMERVDLLDDKEDQGLDVEALAKDLGVAMPALEEGGDPGQLNSLRLWLNRREVELKQRREAQAAFHRRVSSQDAE